MRGSTSPSIPGRSTLLRPRLLAGLAARFSTRVVAVVASAGFGKSTLLAQAVSENRLAPAGLDVPFTCTPDHNALSAFVGDLLVSLSAGSGARPRVGVADHPIDVDSAARAISEAVLSHAPRQVAIILDDLHTLTPGSAARDVVQLLIELLPASGHLVLASRPPLALPLTRLLATGRATLIGEADLTFADDELRDFARARGVSPDLVNGIDGWPALAELIVTTGRRQVADFLWEEVLAGLSVSRLEVLRVLSAIGGGDANLLGELLGRPLDLDVELRAVPLVAVDEDGWWSLHPLWEDAWRSRPPSAEVRRAISRAPGALRRRGLVRPAMRVVIEQQTWTELEPVIVDACSGIAAEAPADLLAEWYARLPEQARASAAGRLLAGTAAKGDNPAAGRRELADAALLFRAEGNIEAELACLLGLFHIAFWGNDLPGQSAVLTRWEELAQHGVPEAQVASALGRALRTHDPVQAQHELDSVPGKMPDRASGSLAVLVDWMRAHLLLLTLGEPGQAVAFASRVLPQAPITLRSSIRCELAEAHRLLGQTGAALDQVAAMRAEACDAVVRSPRHLVAEIVLTSFTGRAAQARAALEELRPLARVSHLHWARMAEAIATAAVRAGGDDEGAARALAEIADNPAGRPLVLLRISPASLPLHYVLVPGQRAMWEQADLKGALGETLQLVRALTDVREGHGWARVDALAPDLLQAARAQLPIPWAVLLGTALVARGRMAGLDLVRPHGAAARPPLHALESAGGPLAKAARTVLGQIPPTPSRPLAVQVLGPLRLSRDGEPVETPNLRRERVRQLLGLLVVQRSVPRPVAAAALWPDLDDAAAAKNLRVTLNYLQQVLEPDRDERDAPYYLRARGTMLELTGEPELSVDLWAVEHALQEAHRAEQAGTPSMALPAYLRAVEHYRGDLLDDLPVTDWLDVERDGIKATLVAVFVRAGNLLLATGDHAAAERVARRALIVEPCSEESYHVLGYALLAGGDRVGAVRAVDRCFDMLTDLGVEAGAVTIELAAAARRGG